jgi:chemotaxis protein methyltransferase WspC
MSRTKFVELLRQSMGLDVESIGWSHIERAVQERQSARGLVLRSAYWDYLCADEMEQQALIEAVVVPETWFFRDREAFTALGGIAQQRRLSAATTVLRLLSLPSSTGEEPYSMAMALLDAGVAPDRFRIDALDISGAAIARAIRAVYGKNSFRGHDLSYRERYFDLGSDGWRLHGTVRRQVTFRQANLLAGDHRSGQELYDAVFCRNLLIYFDRPTQDRAVAVLRSLLTPTGTLFVAPSETGLMLNHQFVSAKLTMAYAFRQSVPASLPRVERSASRLLGVRTPPVVAVLRAIPVAPQSPKSAPPGHVMSLPSAGLERASQLANGGDLAQAEACCEEHVRQHGPSAAAFHLMGVVSDASGNQSAAADYYRKALYLDPDHHETLVHLALLVDQQGNHARAQTLRNRADRVQGARV